MLQSRHEPWEASVKKWLIVLVKTTIPAIARINLEIPFTFECTMTAVKEHRAKVQGLWR